MMRRLFFATLLFAMVAISVHVLFLVTNVAPGTTGNLHAVFKLTKEPEISGLLVSSPGAEQAAFVHYYGEDSPPVNEPRVTQKVRVNEPEERAVIWRPEVKTEVIQHKNTRQERESFLQSIGGAESERIGSEEETATPISNFEYQGGPTPNRLTIGSIEVDAPIVIPSGTDIDVLDEALTRGVVYYPGSAAFGEKGNAFLFGHSSWLPYVLNKNFEVFNDLGKLNPGNIIIIHAEGKKYPYKVTGKRVASHDELWVDFTNKEKKRLTLVTCDSFGAKSDRVVVEAELVEI